MEINKCDLETDYIKKYNCIKNGGENINFNLDDFLNEKFNSPASKIELETIKSEVLEKLSTNEIKLFRDKLIELSNQRGRDDRLQLRELAYYLYKTEKENINNNSDSNIEKQQNNITFNIQSGYIKLNPIGGFADGKYKIYNYNISPISKEKNIYNLDIDFVLHKKHMSFKHSEHLEFQYNNYKGTLTIKYHGQYFNIPVLHQRKIIKNHGNCYISIGEKLKINIKNLHMNIFFKAD